MKIAFVVQRYGQEVNGGAELLCRGVAEHLINNIDIEIITTCAKDYITWANDYPEGLQKINKVPVRRFIVEKERSKKFNKYSAKIFNKKNISHKEEIEWFYKQGPVSQNLIDYIKSNKNTFDRFVFFTYLYFPTVFGLPLVADKSILVPAAHDEPPIKLNIFKSLFNTPQAIIYNTNEEKEFATNLFKNSNIKSDVIGTGVKLPNRKISSNNFKKKFGLNDFLLYVGRIDMGKGLDQLLDYFLKCLDNTSSKKIKLVLIGKQAMSLPKHPNIVSLGFVSEEDKFNAIAAAKIVLVPSPLESFSIISMESWLLKKPILVNGQSPVLVGNCTRSNGGLYYNNFEEFNACLSLLLTDKNLSKKLGQNGCQFVEQNYAWPIIKRKYLSILQSPFNIIDID